MLDGAGTVLSWNEGAVRTKGYASEEIVGRNFDLFYTAEDRASGVPAANLERAAREGTQRIEGWRHRKDGSHFWAMITIDAVHDEHGTFVGFVKVTCDLTEKYEFIRRIEHQATHDALTGILNRGGVLRQLADALDKAQPLAVHYIDLDSFKAVNDSFGHHVGDEVLVTTARRLTQIADGHGLAGRIGGDEFVVVQPNLRPTSGPRKKQPRSPQQLERAYDGP